MLKCSTTASSVRFRMNKKKAAHGAKKVKLDQIVDSGQLQLQKTRINFYTLAHQTYDDLNKDKAEKICKIEGRTYPPANVDLRDAEIFCDPQYIKRVLNNLISNALNYCSWVDTRIQLLPSHALVTVSDGGESLDEADTMGI